ncbi:zinc finger protein 271 [Frankliniella occidentalis]|uniref:Zinc finger protein 271 n=1 Tax=Frankliniella occidentalis TaxID=133901 RepID=A0A6J1TKR8_FRAOC|nr:zinc finger protein 271 [Frankliniella occidentalis]XP_026292274.1 zinc finger protein 271 [Frankliniella occidentalis]XP_026292276.1 zinc finger protein 271 [Frankliniella occidentalis]
MENCHSHPPPVGVCVVNNVSNNIQSSSFSNTDIFQGNLRNVSVEFNPPLYGGSKNSSVGDVKTTQFSDFPSETLVPKDNDIVAHSCESGEPQILYITAENDVNTSDFNNLETQMTSVINADSANIPEASFFTEKTLQCEKYQDMCRICAKETDNCILVFSNEGLALSLVDKIHHCLPIKISENDGLPQQICNSCASKLQTSYELFNISVAGDAKLKAMSLMLAQLDMPTDNCCIIKDGRAEDNDAITRITKKPKLQALESSFPTNSVADAQQTIIPSEETEKRPWSCSECDYKASRQTSLALHVQNKHKRENDEIPDNKLDDAVAEKLEYICGYCDKCFGSEAKLKKHTLLHTKLSTEKQSDPRSCSLCNEKFSTYKKLRAHVKCAHNVEEEPKYNCDRCDKSYRLAGSLDIHRATHSNETPYLCDICGKSFKHGSNLRCHKRSHVEGKLTHRFSCDKCPKTFPSRFQLSEHANVHLNATPYACGVCGKKFHRRIQLRQHRIIHNSESSYECPQCGVCFNRRGNMTQHMKRHSKERKFVCKVCKESFQSLSEVVQHRREHTEKESFTPLENGEFSCSKCEKLFSSVSDLDEHTKSHSDIKFECEICNKLLSNRRTLDYHMRCFHTQERPFSCQYCSESFVAREACTVHERIHTGEKPYSCSECKMSFRCSSNLAQHLNTHSDNRPWACEHCPKRFKRKGILLVHMRTHTGEKPFCCDICGRRFSQKNDMLKHQHTHSSAKQTFLCVDCNWPFHTRKELNKHRRTHHIPTEVQSNANITSAPSIESQALLIRDDLSQFPVTILEEGSNLIVHQIEDLGKDTQIVELNPNEPNPQIIHFTDSLLQTVVPQYQILTVQAPSVQQMVQFDVGPSVSTIAPTPTSQSNW